MAEVVESAPASQRPEAVETDGHGERITDLDGQPRQENDNDLAGRLPQ